MKTVFELNDLRVSLYKKKNAVEIIKGISFSVAPGECLGILGESGSGKSMTMKAALGLLDCNFKITGSAKLQGEELLGKTVEELRNLRGSKVGIVLQNPMTCFDPLYRVGYQIAESFKAHTNFTSREIRELSIQLLNKMKILNPEEVLEKYPHQLSGGMLQRIMIGIALSMNPDLLIVDEPTTAIDSITQFEILNEFVRIKKENNVAMIFISHDLNAIAFAADRIIVLNDGMLVESGDFHHIMHHASDAYTRLLADKQTDVMRRYMQVMKGEERC